VADPSLNVWVILMGGQTGSSGQNYVIPFGFQLLPASTPPGGVNPNGYPFYVYDLLPGPGNHYAPSLINQIFSIQAVPTPSGPTQYIWTSGAVMSGSVWGTMTIDWTLVTELSPQPPAHFSIYRQVTSPPSFPGECAVSSVYDPYSNTVLMFGGSQICQVVSDPTSPSFGSLLNMFDFAHIPAGIPQPSPTLNAPATIQFDAGSVDGNGHIFIGDPHSPSQLSAQIVWISIVRSKNISNPDSFGQVVGMNDIDDVIPLFALGKYVPFPALP